MAPVGALLGLARRLPSLGTAGGASAHLESAGTEYQQPEAAGDFVRPLCISVMRLQRIHRITSFRVNPFHCCLFQTTPHGVGLITPVACFCAACADVFPARGNARHNIYARLVRKFRSRAPASSNGIWCVTISSGFNRAFSISGNNNSPATREHGFDPFKS